MALREVFVILLLHITFSVQQDCLTTELPPRKCIFPFIYQDVVYNGCTNTSDKEGKPWCATEVDEDGKYILYSKNFGHCDTSCPKHQDNPTGDFGLRQASSDDFCGQNEECIDQGQCEEFLEEKSTLSLFRPASQEYRQILAELQRKICNRESQKVCCSCPCLNKDQCPYITGLYEANDFTNLKSLICNKKERKFYCCGSPIKNDKKARPEEAVIPGDPKSDPSWLPDPKEQECGYNESPPSRVKGGEATQPGEYPYTALVGSTDASRKISWKCGATLINHWYVLTAAHCQGSTSNKRISKVRLGEWSVKEELDCWKNNRGESEFCLDRVQDFDISPGSVTVHEDYQPRGTFENDIALVKLDRAAVMGRGVSMVCLPGDRLLAARQLNVPDLDPNSGLKGKYGIVVGWGYTEYDPYKGGAQGDISKYAVAQNTLQKLEIPVMSTEECSFQFRERFSPAVTQICAGGEFGKDSCKGDSGGPLYFKAIAGRGTRPSDDNLEPVYLMGIVSFGSKRCGNGTPGVYTSVKEYISWIKKIIRRK